MSLSSGGADEPPNGAERWLEHVVTDLEAGRQVRDVLLRSLRLSRQMVRRLAVSEGVRLNGTRPFLSSPVRAGDVVSVRLTSVATSGLRPVSMELDIVFEDDDLLVLNKPPGILVHPTRRSHVRTLAHGILAYFQSQGITAPIHPVHRLDRDTSGLVLFARHSVAHQRLDRQMQARTLRRSYLAVVQGVMEMEQGAVDAPIHRHREEAHLRGVGEGVGVAARTRFRVLERLTGATLVEVQLETGRTHQIRVHMAHVGHPLVGDEDYGGAAHPACSRQALHAWQLSLVHPLTREPMRLEAPVPPDMTALIGAWRAAGAR